MKKLLLIALALLLVLSLLACGDDKETTKDTDTNTPAESTTEPDETTTEPDETTTEPDSDESDESTEPESSETTTEAPAIDPSAFIEVKETVYVYNTDILNIRASYSTDSEKVGEMKEGESVIRTGYNNEWSRILFYGETRYANSAFLTTTAPFEYTDKTETVYVTSTQLNLRAKASPDATIVASLKHGDAIERTGVSTTTDENGYEWSRLLYNGQVCYANSAHLATSPSASATLAFDDVNDVVYTTAENTVNLREDASSTATIVASVGYGTRLERTGLATAPDAEGITWSRVKYNDKICYITTKYLTTAPTVSFEDADETLYITAEEALNMRSTPSLNGAILRALKRGTAVHCIGKATAKDSEEITWYKIEVDGVTGYASASFLSPEQPEANS